MYYFSFLKLKCYYAVEKKENYKTFKVFVILFVNSLLITHVYTKSTSINIGYIYYMYLFAAACKLSKECGQHTIAVFARDTAGRSASVPL